MSEKDESLDISYMSQEDVYKIINMAGQLYGFYSPQMSNQNLINLQNNPLFPTREGLDKALTSAPYDRELLASFSEFASSYDRIFSRTKAYFVNMLAFDLDITCRNAKAEDYKTQEYKDDLNRVYKFLDKFQYKEHFGNVVNKLMQNGIDYTWFRDSQGTFDKTGLISVDDKPVKKQVYSLQQMPQKYCMITGQWENGYLYDVDMSFLLLPGVDINSYDPVFKEYYNDTFGDIENKSTYIPTAPMNDRDGTFAYWHQTSIDDGAYVFTFDSSNFNAAPPLAPLIKNILTDNEIESLQRDTDFLAARGILVGDIPRLEKQKSGETQDAMAWTPKTLTKFMSLVKAGLDKHINAVAMPTEATKFYQFDNKDTDSLYANTLETTAANAASAARLIYSSGKPGQFELQAQIQSDYNMMKKLYNQFNAFMNFFVNKKTRKFKFNFSFSGSNYDFIREQEKKHLMDLANVGIVLNESAYSKIVGLQPNDFHRSLTEGHYSDFSELLTPLMSIHTQSAKTEGRPTTENPTESTANNYEAG